MPLFQKFFIQIKTESKRDRVLSVLKLTCTIPKEWCLVKKPRCGIIDFDSSFNHNIGLDYNFATGRSTSFGSLWCKIQIYQANKISDCTTKSDIQIPQFNLVELLGQCFCEQFVDICRTNITLHFIILLQSRSILQKSNRAFLQYVGISYISCHSHQIYWSWMGYRMIEKNLYFRHNSKAHYL